MSSAKIKYFFVQASKISLLVIFLVSIFISSATLIVANFGTKKASAAAGNPAATYNWENYITITDSDGNFWQNTAGKVGVTKYLLAGDADPGCADYIEFTLPRGAGKIDDLLINQNLRTNATLHVLTPSTSATNKNCQDASQKITIGNPDAEARLYYWESQTTIRRLQGYDEVPAVAYIQSTTDSPLFIEEGGAKCPDLIYVNAGNATGKFMGQSDVKNQIQDIGWLPNGEHIYWSADNPAGTGCYDTKNKFNDAASTIALTLTANAKLLAKDAKGVPPTGATSGTKEANSCYGFSPFSWMLCPILDLADGIYGFAKGIVKGLLYVEPTDLNNTGLKQSWSIMRNFASILIVLVAVVMIGSQIFSFEFMTAYTIKKVLPRLVIAAILIQLSWFIFTTLIIFMNAVGSGLYALLTQPFVGVGGGDIMDIAGQIKNNSAIGSAISQGTIFAGLTSAIVVGVLSAVSGGALLSFILVAIGVIISILVAIFTLIVRKILILLLLALAPLALVAWILPNTQKFWDMWWKLFSRLLLMFPLIMVLFASGVIAANVLSFSTETDPIKYIIIIIAYFAPIFLVPSTFKFAGGMFTNIVSAIDKAGNKAKGSGFFGFRDQAKADKDFAKKKNIDRAYKALGSDDTSGFRRGIARWRTGTVSTGIGGTRSKRDFNTRFEDLQKAGRNAAFDEGMKTAAEDFSDKGVASLGYKDRQDIMVSLIGKKAGEAVHFKDASGTEHSITAGQFTSRQALDTLAKDKNTKGLYAAREIIDSIPSGPGASAADVSMKSELNNSWNSVIAGGANFGGIDEKNPYLTRGGAENGFSAEITAGKMTGWDTTSVQGIGKYMADKRAKVSDASLTQKERNDAQAHIDRVTTQMGRSIAEIATNKDKHPNVSIDMLKEMTKNNPDSLKALSPTELTALSDILK